MQGHEGVAGIVVMETFGKASKLRPGSSATVALVSRLGLRLGAASLLLLAGASSSLLAAGPSAVRDTTTTASTTTTSTAPVVLSLSGRGWGHGLGLSQWGAYGYARHGWRYDAILAHYYTGTSLGPAPLSRVRVLLARSKRLVLVSTVGWTVTDAVGTRVHLDPGTLTLKPKLTLPGQSLEPPLTFTSSRPLVVGVRPYRGTLVVSSDGQRLQLVDVLGLEAYLKGVVPAEMPSAWPAEALKAQAVAARSYALANLTQNRDFDLFADTRSQVYGGIDAESTAASAAVDATRGEVVLWNGKVADTLFFSTSGGRTASAEETTGRAVPYLVSVPDPYDTASPYHEWGPVLVDGAKLAKQLKLAAPLAGLTQTAGSSGHVKTVTFVDVYDAQSTITGAQLRARLELRSTWFSTTLLSLLPITKAMTYGGAVSLTGFARGTDAVSLEARPAGSDWSSAGEVLLGADGTFSTVVKPQVSTQYRLASGSVRAGLAKIAVAPRVEAAIDATGLAGTAKPPVAGAAVQLQRQDGTAWSTVASAVTDAAGSWTFTMQLQPGSYRVRCAPGHGLAPGLSAPIKVE
jgi:stage II sporulation protein D